MPKTLRVHRKVAEWARPLQAPARYKGAKGGRSSGKSHFVAEEVVKKCMKDADLRVVCIREIQRSLKFSAKSLIDHKIRSLGLEEHFEILTTEIRRVGGEGIIIFAGMQDHTADSIKSLEGFGLAWVEEAQRLSRRSLELLLPTIRQEGSEIWFSWNPERREDPVEEFLVRSPPEDAVVVHVNYEDNPFCPETARLEAERLRRVDPDGYAHVWLGGYAEHSAAQVLAGKWRVDEFEPLPSWDGPYYGADWGFARDPSVLTKSWIADNRLWIEYEVGGVGVGLDDLADLFRTIPGADEHLIPGDPSRPETIAHLKAKGLKVISAPAWKNSVKDGIQFLRSFEEVVIHERCRNTQQEARLWRYKTDRLTGDPLPQLVDAHNHCLAPETMVETASGPMPIACLVGMEGQVRTTLGWRRFANVRMTSGHENVYRVVLVNGRSFRATASHPVLTEAGWVAALALRPGDTVVSLDAIRYAKGERWDQNTLSSRGTATAGMIRRDTTKDRPRGGGHLPICTEMCGSITMGPSPGGTRCTTPTATNIPRTPLAWSALPKRHIWQRGQTNSRTRRRMGYGETCWSTPCPLRKSGTVAKRGVSGIRDMQDEPLHSDAIGGSVTDAGKRLSDLALSGQAGFAQMPVSRHGGETPGLMMFDGNALVVGANFGPTNTKKRDAVPSRVQQSCVAVARVVPDGSGPVYNMEVDEAHHFAIEGGVIVHNCWDSIRYALSKIIKKSGKRKVAFISG